MKKLIALFLAAVMLLSLAACGSTAANTASDDTDTETASTDTSAETPPELPDGETPPENPDGTPPDGENGQPGDPAALGQDAQRRKGPRR